MGLCKCPLKKVTNLFCFEHRVNVCDSCLLASHSQCIVQTYLKWLQDSDYSPECRLCSTPLADHPTVRLLCLHLYHKHCMTKHAAALPPTTAPASYTCLTCQEAIFPDASNKSPIAETLRTSLATETWARPGLGLPIEKREFSGVERPGPPQLTSTPAHPRQVAYTDKLRTTLEYTEPKVESGGFSKPKQDSIPVGIVNPVTGSYDRKVVVDSRDEALRPSVSTFDCDDDKYRRRSLREWITRWIRLHAGSKIRDDDMSANLRRWIVLFIIGLIGLLTVIIMLTRVNSEHAANDPFVNLGRDNKIQINPK